MNNNFDPERIYTEVINRSQTLEAYSNWDYISDIENRALSYIPDNIDVIVEFGCGAGRFTQKLSSKCNKYIGIDNSKKMLDLAKKKNPKIKFVLKDVADTEWCNHKCDCVLFMHNGIDSIYPSTRRMQVLKNAFDILITNGYFIYSSHLQLESDANMIESNGHKYYKEDYHGSAIWVHRATLVDLEREITSIGFKIVNKLYNYYNNDCWIYFIVEKV